MISHDWDGLAIKSLPQFLRCFRRDARIQQPGLDGIGACVDAVSVGEGLTGKSILICCNVALSNAYAIVTTGRFMIKHKEHCASVVDSLHSLVVTKNRKFHPICHHMILPANDKIIRVVAVTRLAPIAAEPSI